MHHIASAEFEHRKRSIPQRLEVEFLACVKHHHPAVLVGRDWNGPAAGVEFGKAEVDFPKTVFRAGLHRRIGGAASARSLVGKIATNGQNKQAEDQRMNRSDLDVHYFAVVNEASTNDPLPPCFTAPMETLYLVPTVRKLSGTTKLVMVFARFTLINVMPE